jgi:hypothetical protein
MTDLVDYQKVVERMSTDGRPLAETEEYIELCALHEMEKAGLWMLAWAHQDQATQLRLAKETLALAVSMHTTTSKRRRGPHSRAHRRSRRGDPLLPKRLRR